MFPACPWRDRIICITAEHSDRVSRAWKPKATAFCISYLDTMTDPSQPDDDWAELARELDRDTQPVHTPESASHEEESAESLAESDSDEFEDADSEGGLESSENESDEAGGEGEQEPGDGTPGTGRKRRRRRRRRRKGGPGQPAEAGETAAAEAGEAEVAEVEADPAPEAVEEDSEYDESNRGESEVEAAEEAGGELLRELIANWNVPSWDDIVSGLHRPDR
jgi:ribonuclease E